MTPSVLVVVPTYDERESVGAVVDGILSLGVPGLEVLVVDDQSPDGTADLVEALARTRPGLSVLRRPPPAGRGLAGRDGFLRALESGAARVVEMDGDGSHQPRHLPALLAALDGCDLAVGSRRAPGGRDDDRPLSRRVLTLATSAYARLVLGLPVADANSGFRAFTREALLAVDPATLRAKGPEIVQETLFRAVRAGLRVREVPIEFVDRRRGESKLGPRKLASAALAALKLRLGGR